MKIFFNNQINKIKIMNLFYKVKLMNMINPKKKLKIYKMIISISSYNQNQRKMKLNC